MVFRSMPRRFGRLAGALGCMMACMMALAVAPAAAQITWTGDGDGTSWSDPANWSPATVPGAGDVATIGTTATVTLASATTVAHLTLSSAGATLILEAALTLDRLDLASGTLTGTADLTVSDSLAWSGGTMSGSGTTTLGRTGALLGSQTKTLDARTLVVQNGATLAYPPGTHYQFFGGNGASLILETGARLDIESSTAFRNFAVFSGSTEPPQIFNAGTIRKPTGTTSTFEIDWDVAMNGGAVEVTAGTMRLDGTLYDAGGAYRTGTGARLILNPPPETFVTFAPTSSFSGAGAMEFMGGTATLLGTYNVTGPTEISGFGGQGARVTFDASMNLISKSIDLIGVRDRGALTVALADPISVDSLNLASFSSLGFTAPVTVGNGLFLGNANATLELADDLTVNGPLVWQGGTLRGTAAGVEVRLAGGGRLTGGAGSAGNNKALDAIRLVVPAGATLTYEGTRNFTGTNGAVLEIQDAAVLDVQQWADFEVDAASTAPPVIENAGVLRKTGGDSDTRIAWDLVNTGTVEVSNDELRFRSAFTDGGGTYRALPGGTLVFETSTDSPITFTAASTLEGAGTMVFDRTAVVTLNGTYNVTGTTRVLGAGTFARADVTFAPEMVLTSLGTLDIGAGFTSGGIARIQTATMPPVPALTLGGSGELYLTPDLTVTGTAHLGNRGTLIEGPGDVVVQGVLTWQGGVLRGPGTTWAQGGVIFTGGAGSASWNKTLDARRLVLVEGTTSEYQGTRNFTGTNGAVLEIQDAAVLDVQQWADFEVDAASTAPPVIENAGVLRKTGGDSDTRIAWDLVNTGTVEVTNDILLLQGTLTDSDGTYRAGTGATLDIRPVNDGVGPTFTAASSIEADAGATVNFGTTFSPSGILPIRIEGTYDVQGRTTVREGNVAEVTIAETATVVNLGAEGVIVGSNRGRLLVETTDPLTIGALEVGFQGTLEVNGPLTVTGALSLAHTSATMVSTSEVAVQGVLTWQGGVLRGPGTTWAQSGVIFTGGAGSASWNKTLDARRLVLVEGTTSEYRGTRSFTGTNGAVLEIQDAAVLDVQQWADFEVDAASTAPPVIENAGVLRKTGGDSDTRIAWDLVNTGTVEVTNDLLDLRGAVTNTAGGFFQGTATLGLQNATSVTNAGTLAPGTDGTVGTLTVAGDLDLGTGTLALDVGGTTPGVTLDSLAVTGAATLGGTLALNPLDGYDPAPGIRLPFLAAASVTGTFDAIAPGFASGQTATVEIDATSATAVITAGTAPARLEGTVTDATTSDPIPGAQVAIDALGLATTTGPDGTYAFPSVTPGTYTVEARFTGYQTGSAEVTLADGETVTQDFALTPVSTDPATLSWTGAAGDGLWSTGGNWDLGRAPAAQDTAVVNLDPGSSFTLQVAADAAVARLDVSSARATVQVDDTLHVSDAFTLSAGGTGGVGTLIVDGTAVLSGGHMGGDGTAVFNGPTRWTGRAGMSGNGTTVLNGTTTLRATEGFAFQTVELRGRTLEINGTLAIVEGLLEPLVGATIRVTETGVIDFQAAETGIRPTDGTTPRPRLLNEGLITKTAGEGFFNTAQIGNTESFTFGDRRMTLTNTGTIRSANGGITLYLDEASVLGGLVEANSTVTLQRGEENTSEPIAVAATIRGDGTMLVNDPFTFTGTIDLAGSMTVRQDQTFAADLTLTQLGELVVSTNPFEDGIFEFDVAGTPTIARLDVRGVMRLGSALVVQDTLVFGERGPATLTGTGDLTVAAGGEMRWGIGTMGDGGTLTIRGSLVSTVAQYLAGDFRVQRSEAMLVGRALVLDGTATWDDAPLTLDAGATVQIAEGGVFDLTRDAEIRPGEAATSGEAVTSDGTLRKTGVGRRTSTGEAPVAYDDVSHGTVIGVPFVNGGTLALEAGRTAFTGALTHTGLVQGTDTLDVSAEGLTVTSTGTFAPGTPTGRLTVVGPLDLRTSTLAVDLGGTDPATGYDQLRVEGAVTLGGTLAVTLLDPFRPSDGDAFAVLDATAVEGTFETVSLPSVAGTTFEVSTGDTAVVVQATVTAENRAPVAVDDEATTPEDQAVAVNVLRNDTDADGDALAIAAFTQPERGTVARDGDSTLVYTPAADVHGTDAFTYVLSDGALTDTATVTVTITPVNDPPVAVDDTTVTSRNTPRTIDVLANDRDPDGDALTIASAASTSTEGGLVEVLDAAAIRYTPPADFEGLDTFTYVVSDGNGGTDEGTVRVTVELLRYTVTDLGTLGGAASRAMALNDAGVVVGLSLDAEGRIQAFRWVEGTMTRLGEAAETQAFAINADGLVAGQAVVRDDTAHAVLFRPDGTLLDLGTLGGRFSTAYALNDAGVVVGTATGSTGAARGFVWADGAMQPAGPAAGAHSEVQAVNRDGLVAGHVQHADGTTQAFRGSDLLPLNDATASRAYDLGDEGTVVGSLVQSGATRAAIWTGDAVQALPDLGGPFAEAYARSEAGWIVGVAGLAEAGAARRPTPAATPQAAPSAAMRLLHAGPPRPRLLAGNHLRAVLWREGTVRDLNTLIGDGTGWILQAAWGINADGAIVGHGLLDGQLRAFLLTPADNLPPVAVDDAFSLEAPAAGLLLPVLANDTDERQGLRIVQVAPPAHGQAEIREEAAVWYTPADGFAGTDRFTYTIADAQGATSTAVVTVHVAPHGPAASGLEAAYPNPFAGKVTLTYAVSAEAHVVLELYNVLGQRVRRLVDQPQTAGRYTVHLDGQDLAAGLYYCRLQVGTQTTSRPLVRR